jgi:hypothetical protein
VQPALGAKLFNLAETRWLGWLVGPFRCTNPSNFEISTHRFDESNASSKQRDRDEICVAP